MLYRDLLNEYPRAQKRVVRVGIAQIGLSKSGDIMTEFYKIDLSGILRLRRDKVEIIRSKVKNLIEKKSRTFRDF